MNTKMTKAEMINEIIGAAKTAALVNNAQFNGADLFFKLAFTTEKNLAKICKGLKKG